MIPSFFREVELRRRLKAEKQAALESNIASIKSRMKETEDNQAKVKKKCSMT